MTQRGAQRDPYLPAKQKLKATTLYELLVCTYLVLHISLKITGNGMGAIGNDRTGTHDPLLPYSSRGERQRR